MLDTILLSSTIWFTSLFFFPLIPEQLHSILSLISWSENTGFWSSYCTIPNCLNPPKVYLLRFTFHPIPRVFLAKVTNETTYISFPLMPKIILKTDLLNLPWFSLEDIGWEILIIYHKFFIFLLCLLSCFAAYKMVTWFDPAIQQCPKLLILDLV